MKPKTVGRASGANPNAGHLAQAQTFRTGLVAGAIVLTLDGELPVEVLAPGDRIITRDSGAAKIVNITHRRLLTRSIRLAAGSLGHLRPDRDVMLAGDQTVLLRDWRARALFGHPQAMAQAHTLIDGEFITDLGVQSLHLFQIVCDTAHVLYADGLEVGTADVRAQTPKAAAA